MSNYIKQETDKMLNIEQMKGEDISDGSFFQMIASMYAIEGEFLNNKGDKILLDSYAETASEEYLELIGQNIGIERYQGRKAIGTVYILGTQGATINKGDICFRSKDNVEYIFDETKTLGVLETPFVVICKEVGDIGNCSAGDIDRVKNIAGVSQITNKNDIITGEDIEELEKYKARVIKQIKTPARSGNKADFEMWAIEVDGVYRSLCTPIWSGDGTVKVTIMSEDGLSLDSTKQTETKDYIIKKMPIGAELTVNTVTEIDVNINLDLELNVGYDINDATTDITRLINKFFIDKISLLQNELSFIDLSYIIHSSETVKRISSFTLNGASNNISLGAEEVPKLNTLNITEV